jgi:transposase
MPRPHLPESRQRAIELARLKEKPMSQIAAELGISHSCLRNWVKQTEIDDRTRSGLSSEDRAALVALRREPRVAKMESEVLKRGPAAYFARDHGFQNDVLAGSYFDSPEVVGPDLHFRVGWRRWGSNPRTS